MIYGSDASVGAATERVRNSRLYWGENLSQRNRAVEEIKPMDRPNYVLSTRILACLIGVQLGLSGCRSTRSEVPPGKPYQTTGGMPPTVGFSSEPHPSTANGMAGLYRNKASGSFVQDVQDRAAPAGDVTYGMPNAGNGTVGLPTDNRYGPPSTSGGADPAGTAAPSIANSLIKGIPSASKMLEKDPYASPASGTSAPGGAYP
jgi:hypothetical protein